MCQWLSLTALSPRYLMSIHPAWSLQEHCNHPTLALQLTSDLDRVTVAGKSNSKLVSERSVRAWLCSAVSSPIWSWLTLAWSLICSRQWTLGHLQPGICQGQPAVLPQLSGTFLPQLQPLWSPIIGYISFYAAHLSLATGTVQVTTFRRVCVYL